MKTGQHRPIPATQIGSKRRWHVLGGYNWLKDTITWSTAATRNTATFIEFLEELLLRQYPTGSIVLVMDIVPYHKSAADFAALRLFEHRVAVIWLPPYFSDLIPIERFWRFLKDLACANHLEDRIEDVVGMAEKVMPHRMTPLAIIASMFVSPDLR